MLDLLAFLRTAYDLTPSLAFFDLPSGVNNAIIGLHTGAGDFVVKTLVARPDPAMLEYEVALLRWLATQRLSFAVPAPLPTRNGDLSIATPEGYQLLMPWLSGQLPVYQDPVQIEAVGAALGELHPVLARYPQTSRPGNPSYGALEQIHPRLPDPYGLTPMALELPPTPTHLALFDWWRAELAALRTFINGVYLQLPHQVIHSDYGPSNTLYEDGRITAVLDFEFAGPDVRAIDIAAGLVFSMRLWENPTPLMNAAAFCRGYGRHQQLTAAEIEAIPWLMRLRNATSNVWWLGREVAAGTGNYGLDRITDMQQMVIWLHEHEQAFREILRMYLGQQNVGAIVGSSRQSLRTSPL